MYIHTYIKYINKKTCMYIHIHVYIYIYVHIYTYMHIHVYKYIHLYVPSVTRSFSFSLTHIDEHLFAQQASLAPIARNLMGAKTWTFRRVMTRHFLWLGCDFDAGPRGVFAGLLCVYMILNVWQGFRIYTI